MCALQIIETGDGSHTLLNTDLDETYHSRHGALRESKYVFIQRGLLAYIESNPSITAIKILEIGLGTGLNAWLTMQEADQLPDIQFHYTALEPYPLEKDVLQQLNYIQLDSPEHKLYFNQIHQSEENQTVSLTDNFSLNKRTTKVQDIDFVELYNVVYFDAFAPNKQPELWEKSIIEKVIDTLVPSGVWVTYSAKGQLKRDLRSLDLQVETLPGPPGKAEMVRAVNKT